MALVEAQNLSAKLPTREPDPGNPQSNENICDVLTAQFVGSDSEDEQTTDDHVVFPEHLEMRLGNLRN